MIDAGILTENDQVELIFGEIVEKMSIGKRHGDCVDKLMVYFVLKYGLSHTCRSQNPLIVGDTSEPEPDFAILDKASYEARSGKPMAEDVHLILEVSDTTLEYDRSVKAKLYALGGIPEYWIINLQQDQVEVYLNPDKTTGEYNRLQRFAADDTFESPFWGGVSVSDLLPSK
ncbi:MAG: Uma2 family endonuclease [Bacteroidota bacterium]